MRIDSLGRPIAGSAATRVGTAHGGFSLQETTFSEASRRPPSLRAAPSLDALIALQAIPEERPRERRRREVARGRSLLDALDGIKLALIEGRDDPAALAALAAALRERRDATGETGLDDVLSAIELRAKVELAKRST